MHFIAKEDRLDTGERVSWFDPGTEAIPVQWFNDGKRGLFCGVRNGASSLMMACMAEFVCAGECDEVWLDVVRAMDEDGKTQ